jgi:hypothetical protein
MTSESIEPSQLWDSETRAGYREIPIQKLWTSWPAEAGAERDRRRPGRIMHNCGAGPGRIMHNCNIDTSISIVTHPVSGVCTLAVQWESMRTVCRRSWVQNPFASFLNPDQERYELVCFGMYWYVPVSFSMNWYELVCTDIYLLVTVYSSMYKYTHSPVSMRQYVLVCTGTYQYILVYTSIYSDFQFTNSVLPRYSIHGGTWKYMAVPESPVYLDYGGTSRYMAVQSLVP